MGDRTEKGTTRERETKEEMSICKSPTHWIELLEGAGRSGRAGEEREGFEMLDGRRAAGERERGRERGGKIPS